ncbi:protein of unknown function DUF664 [Kribbella flavida DSM 17836]|uniref:DUF664 domain-containing protein n=1 Tax=Kribbella flavida (strain DSM 17836 / JCM 10339 / NBRC 14399) TaxID=479435 RepID=D2PL36_KRIFD|nr:DinB family protein [Kribbella flavida]ADB34291.1 protein of unknown function DUF664 [Kribbella flavida DSM 17836]
MAGVKEELWAGLRAAREANLRKAEGLSEYDLRRPMTASGTNLLGVLKHLGGMECGYLGETFGRDLDRVIPGDEDWEGAADLWARPDESAGFIVDWYREACAHADATIAMLELDAPGWVGHWDEGHQATTLGAMMVRVLGEECRHGGQLDVVRELVDGTGDARDAEKDPEVRRAFVARVQAAADVFGPQQPH